MSRLVVISNRLADPRKAAAGGLAVALGEALNQTGGLWFGWSGTVVEGGTPGEGELHTRHAGPVTLATVDLCREDHDAYYQGYSNSVLWPVFHYRLDLADFNASYIAGYRRVNQMFARKLLPLLREDDIIWVHDYHLIPLAAELRAMGCHQRIGFFLHIPMPPPLIMAAIPQRPLNLAPPPSVKMVWMEEDGVLASARGCPGAREYPLLDVSLPTEASACGKVQGAPKGMMKWLKGLFD